MWVAMNYHLLLPGWRASFWLCWQVLWFTVDYFLTLGSNTTSQLGEYMSWVALSFRWLHVCCSTTFRAFVVVFFGCTLLTSLDGGGRGCHSSPASGTLGSTQSPDTLRCNKNMLAWIDLNTQVSWYCLIIGAASSIWGKGDNTTIE